MSDSRAIRSEVIFSGFSSRVDGSLSFRGNTPELTVAEKVAMMGLQGLLCEMLVFPKDEKEAEVVEIQKEMDQKSQCQRQRACLFIMWKATAQDVPFERFYYLKMEQIIEGIKSKLPPPGKHLR